jgi:hypothetical protein
LKIQMSHRVVGAFAISLTLSAAHARAQDDKQEGDAVKPATTDAAKAAEEEEEEEEPAKPAPEAKAEVKAEIGTSTGAQAEASASGEPKPADVAKAAERPVMYGARGDWFIQPYGYARFDGIHDTTQSFEDGIQPNLIARPGTYKGQHRRTMLMARDSRVGIYVGAPEFHGIKTTGQLEFDFFGIPPTDVRRHDKDVFSPIRMRHAYLKIETSAVDVIAGQYYTPFGWNGHFYPATGAFLGVPAQIYHRDPQLRVEKAIHFGDGALTLALAAVRPGQKDSGVPDGHGGVLFEHKAWSGAATSGFGRPSIVPISLGVSGLYRRFELPAFRIDSGAEAVTAQGWGVTAQALLPVIPAKTIEQRGNSLTVTGEFSTGTGIADLYTGMDGGSRLPLLPNPTMVIPAKPYPQNIDPGLVTFDRNWELKTINWRAFVVGLQYYLPVADGKISLSGIYSRVWSDNIKKLTPNASWGAIFTKMEYIDATLSVEITPAVFAGVSYQTVKQTFGDVSADDPVYGAIADTTLGGQSVPNTGGVAASARNNRGQLTMAFFF